MSQSIGLRPGFEPFDIQNLGLNGDTLVDAEISDFDGGPSVRLLNSPNPEPNRFSLGPCVATPPCCLGNAETVWPGAVTFDDITNALANWGNSYPDGNQPGDTNCDGLVNFNDITDVIANWAGVCPQRGIQRMRPK